MFDLLMSALERISSLIGLALIGFAAYIVAGDRKQMEMRQRVSPAVEELGDRLKEAWADHHNA